MTLESDPWFGRHVEIFGDVIIYQVLVVAWTGDKYALTFAGYCAITFFLDNLLYNIYI